MEKEARNLKIISILIIVVGLLNAPGLFSGFNELSITADSSSYNLRVFELFVLFVISVLFLFNGAVGYSRSSGFSKNNIYVNLGFVNVALSIAATVLGIIGKGSFTTLSPDLYAAIDIVFTGLFAFFAYRYEKSQKSK